jgi:hypothetical protein
MRRVSKGGRDTSITCPRKYYLASEYGGVGLETTRTTPEDIDLAIGIATHKVEHLLMGHSLEEAIRDALDTWASLTSGWGAEDNPLIASQVKEGAELIEAFITGWHLYKQEMFFQIYKVLEVEGEIIFPVTSNVEFYTRLDALLEERSTGNVVVLNHKTCGEWNMSDWLFDPQMQTEAVAAEWSTKRNVVGCVVEGYVKGARRNGLLSNPLIYCYRNPKTGDLKPYYTAGWHKLPVTTLMPLRDWVSQLPQTVVEEHFRRSEVIPRNDPMVEGWLKELAFNETAIENYLHPSVSEADRELFFQRRISKYTCRRCPFKPLCFNETDVETMIKDGHLRLRGERRTFTVQEEDE